MRAGHVGRAEKALVAQTFKRTEYTPRFQHRGRDTEHDSRFPAHAERPAGVQHGDLGDPVQG